TFRWAADDVGTGLWGPDTPPRGSPGVRFADGTLVSSSAQPGVVFIVFGGAKFAVNATAITGLGLNLAQTRVEPADIVNRMPSAPIDFTLLRELSQAQI